MFLVTGHTGMSAFDGADLEVTGAAEWPQWWLKKESACVLHALILM